MAGSVGSSQLSSRAFESELRLLSVGSFACFPLVFVGILWILWFSPTSQKHARLVHVCVCASVVPCDGLASDSGHINYLLNSETQSS